MTKLIRTLTLRVINLSDLKETHGTRGHTLHLTFSQVTTLNRTFTVSRAVIGRHPSIATQAPVEPFFPTQSVVGTREGFLSLFNGLPPVGVGLLEIDIVRSRTIMVDIVNMV